MSLVFTRTPCDEGVIQGTHGEAPCPERNEPWILAATILGSSIVFLDGSVVNVALPVLQRDLGATVTDVQWVVEAYAVFLAALILVGGSLADRLGRRRTFLWGLGVFTLASALGGLSPDARTLVLARAAQGLGGALLAPSSLALVGATFPGERRGRAIGLWSAGTAAAPLVGPLIGGWLVEHASWRWVFYLNLPVALAVLGISVWRVPDSRDPHAERLDWAGALLVTLGLGGVTGGLIESGTRGLQDPAVLGLLALGGVALLAFLIEDARADHPMLPLELFRSRTFSGANLLTFLLYGALAGATFFVPFNLQQVQGYAPTAAGAAMLPVILPMPLLSGWAGALAARSGTRLPLTLGPALAALGLALLAVPDVGGSYWTSFFPALVTLGLGMGITVAPLTSTVMGAVDVRYAGLASGVSNAVARTAGLLAVAIFGLVVVSSFSMSLERRLDASGLQGPPREAIEEQRSRLATIEVPASLPGDLRDRAQRAVAESFVASFRLATLLGAAMAAAGAVTGWLSIDLDPAPGAPTRGGSPRA